MPTYRCLTVSGRLDDDDRARMADAITRLHHEVTGAPPYFAQVLFDEVQKDKVYIGGRPLRFDHVFVHGFIRDGRSAVQRRSLAVRIAEELARTMDMESQLVWVYLTELPAKHMVEFGQLLPEAGDESSWQASLPSDLSEWLQSLGRT
ncbi:MAG: 4-oxalocrotonate tautomerase family protein [Myxococcota bacterium]